MLRSRVDRKGARDSNVLASGLDDSAYTQQTQVHRDLRRCTFIYWMTTSAAGAVGFATLALKLHKFALLGGSVLSAGAAAVIAEDFTFVVVLLGLWHLFSSRSPNYAVAGHACAAERHQVAVRRAKRIMVPRPAAAMRGVTFLVVMLLLLFVGAEHEYFLITRSLLDGDAVVVAAKSFGPIVFIAVSVEGRRLATRLFAATAAVVAAILLLGKFRKAATSARRRESSTGTIAVRCRTVYARAVQIVHAAPKTQLLLISYAICILMAASIFGMGRGDNSRVELLRRNCFIGITLDVLRRPPSGGGDLWAAAVRAAFSSRVVGGLDGAEKTMASSGRASEGFERVNGKGGDKANEESIARPNILIVVLESTGGTYVTPSDRAGVSPWAGELSRRGMSSSAFYSSMPNTNKAMYQILCGMTPSLETAWVEFERSKLLETVCLPGLLRSKLDYRSLLLTGSMVGGLDSFGFDGAVGYAGEDEQGGSPTFRSRRVHDKFSFRHGTFEKVNYLGYDDHVVLNRSIAFLLGDHPTPSTHEGDVQAAATTGDASNEPWTKDERETHDLGGKLLTILTVGPHHHHDVPIDFVPDGIKPRAEVNPVVPDLDGVGTILDKYLSALRYQDTFLQRLYRRLDDTGLSDNTYVVIVGDHGEAFREHGFDKHGSNIYQEGILVPFFITGPPGSSRISPGGTFDRVAMHADIAPTVLDILGLWRPGKNVHAEAPGNREAQQSSADSRLRKSPHHEPADYGRRQNLRYTSIPPARRAISRSERVSQLDGAGSGLLPGSGLVGDSLLGPDERACAVAAVHYGAKALAVVAGRWKGIFLYHWERDGEETGATVLSARMFDLSTDDREQHSLLKESAGGCCRTTDYRRASLVAPGGSTLAASCRAARNVHVLPNVQDRGVPWQPGDSADEAALQTICCHLQAAATTFARDNLRFFGRQR